MTPAQLDRLDDLICAACFGALVMGLLMLFMG